MNLKDLSDVLYGNITESMSLINESTDGHMTVELLPSVDEFIKKNPSTKEITSPVFFSAPGQPNPDGLLSNEIFGLRMEERSSIFGYISLGDSFIHPLIYKKLVRMDNKFRDIIHGTRFFTINSSGELVEDEENGKTGMKWLKANFKNIKIKRTNSEKRNTNIKFIKANEDRMFMNKYLVIPAFYRDVDTSKKGKIAVGEINELYASLLVAVKGIRETEDMGLSTFESIRGRVQELLLTIYDWLCANANKNLEGSTGLSKKMGYITRAGISKTTDFGSRLVISAPELKVERVDDLMVDITHSAIPLSSLCANYFPNMLYHIRRFFDNEFSHADTVSIVDSKTNEISQYRIEDPSLLFPDEMIKEQLKRFIHGYSNRFIPIGITIKDKNGKEKEVFIRFKGKRRKDTVESAIDSETVTDYNLINRRMTWMDIFFIAATECAQNKCILITRYPIDSMYNQFPSKIRISSTKETEPVYYNDEFYPHYPKLTDDDIGKNTSNLFIDTAWISNLMLEAIKGDYDGDTTSLKAVFTEESYEELIAYMNSNSNYIGFDGKCIRTCSNEAIQSMFNLTRVLDGTKLTDVKF